MGQEGVDSDTNTYIHQSFHPCLPLKILREGGEGQIYDWIRLD